MKKFIIVLSILFISFSSLFSLPYETKTIHEFQSYGDIERIYRENPIAPYRTDNLVNTEYYFPSSNVIWHYSVASGLTGKTTAIGYNAQNVFAGTWYGGAKMFTGIGGNGTFNWETPEPEVGTNQYWKYWAAGTAASETSDIFYAGFSWEVWDNMGTPGNYTDDTLISNNFEVRKYNYSSSIPDWTYDGTGYFVQNFIDEPGKIAVSVDGSILAVTGTIDGHFALLFFSDTSSTPIQIYENNTLTGNARQIRLTTDGLKCIFRKSAILYRIDVSTGSCEATHSLGASTDCFGVSPDGSIIAYGFTTGNIITWNGSSYSPLFSFTASGYYAGSAAVCDYNNIVYFGFYRNDYLTNRIYCYDISQSNFAWVYDYPVGSGSNQDFIEWMDCSDDGRWLVVGTWGCQTGGGPEVEVFDYQNPTAPVFTIDTPGSVFHVDISPDGQYISSIGKHVHANTMGSGIDLYFAHIEESGIDEIGQDLNSPVNFVINPVITNLIDGSVVFSFTLSETAHVQLDIYDIKGSKLKTLINTEISSGNHEIVAKLNLPGGIYIYRMTIGENTLVNKMILTR